MGEPSKEAMEAALAYLGNDDPGHIATLRLARIIDSALSNARPPLPPPAPAQRTPTDNERHRVPNKGVTFANELLMRDKRFQQMLAAPAPSQRGAVAWIVTGSDGIPELTRAMDYADRAADAGYPVVPLYASAALGARERAFIDIVFDGSPAPESGRFVEVENEAGASINVGEWIKRGDGLWALRLTRAAMGGSDA